MEWSFQAVEQASGEFVPQSFAPADDYQIDIVARALDVLGLFDCRNKRLGLEDVASRVGISRSRAYRILRTLAAQDFVRVDEAGQLYSLSSSAARLGLVARIQDRIGRTVLGAMYELWSEFRETVNFAVLDQDSVIYAEILESPHPFRMSDEVGQHVPLLSTAIGRSILAALDDPAEMASTEEVAAIRDKVAMACECGYAIDDEETVPGARCVGVALKDPTGTVFGAMSISGPTSRIDDALIPAIGARLIAVAGRIAAPTSRGRSV